MKQKFEAIIKYITGSHFAKFDLSEQFNLNEEDNISISKKLNAAFLAALSGGSHPLYNKATQYLDDLGSHPSWKNSVSFYKEGLKSIHSEISAKCFDDGNFEKDLNGLHSWAVTPESSKKQKDTTEKVRNVFFPEGAGLLPDSDEKIAALREKRKVDISKPNPSPVSDPAKEILFTSNILITIPPASRGLDNIPVSSRLKRILEQVMQEEQLYWYDHPVPVGTAPEQNEVLYGLEGLDRAFEFEKQRGTMSRDAKVSCVLSVSVTHEGLQGMVKEYLEDELRKEKNIRHLNVYVFTEADTLRLIEDILVPAADRFLDPREHSLLYEVFGVDGEYGRHYSFLKAIAALWQVFISPETRGTFKIDLDQVFPQEELVKQSGLSALEHLKTPLWGADGADNEGNNVHLGMIAGALVNQKDIGNSLFTPDVPFPSDDINADELIFFSKLPQAVSTEAEMMTRYTDNGIDGRKHCIQRIHVTGGTNGILIDALRKHRPFTPTFIGRAEDQAYILSVLSDGNNVNLRYVHKDGLIMRHDKEAFAGEAIKMAATGKLLGDYIRILMFSYYARALPCRFEKIKDALDPFTGCFVSEIPLTVVYLRFALKLASFFGENSEDMDQQAFEFSQSGVKRLHETIQKLSADPNPLIEQFEKEKQGWDIFYDVLDKAEENIAMGDAFALELKEKVNALVESCRINF